MPEINGEISPIVTPTTDIVFVLEQGSVFEDVADSVAINLNKSSSSSDGNIESGSALDSSGRRRDLG